MIKSVGFSLVIMGFSLVAVPVAWSCPGTSGMGGKFLQERLGLSDEQTQQVSSAFEQAKERCMGLEGGPARFSCFKESREQIHDKLTEILAPEQLDQFELLRQERKARWHDKLQK